MFEVLEARNLAPDVRYLKIKAPKIAKRREASENSSLFGRRRKGSASP